MINSLENTWDIASEVIAITTLFLGILFLILIISSFWRQDTHCP